MRSIEHFAYIGIHTEYSDGHSYTHARQLNYSYGRQAGRSTRPVVLTRMGRSQASQKKRSRLCLELGLEIWEKCLRRAASFAWLPCPTAPVPQLIRKPVSSRTRCRSPHSHPPSPRRAMALAVSALGAGAAWLNWVVANWHAGPSRKEEEEARAWDYEKMMLLVADVRLPAMVVDLDVLDANTRYIR